MARKNEYSAAARYLEAAQALCKLLASQEHEIRSLKTKLSWQERRRRQLEENSMPKGKPFY